MKRKWILRGKVRLPLFTLLPTLLVCILTVLLFKKIGNLQSSPSSQPGSSPGNSGSSVFTPLTLDDLCRRSSLILRGTVISKGESFSAADKERYTPVTLQVSSLYKGELPGGTVTYNEPSPDGSSPSAGVPILSQGEEVLLFLDKDHTARHPSKLYLIQNHQVTVPSSVLSNTYSLDGTPHPGGTMDVDAFVELICTEVR